MSYGSEESAFSQAKSYLFGNTSPVKDFNGGSSSEEKGSYINKMKLR
jgi:hypothetical protein